MRPFKRGSIAVDSRRVGIRADLFLGARGLALAGGLVTILGIVFFFILAANRGWLTPEIRIGLGTFTSLAVFCAGLWVKRRYGRLQAALASVSAGIAGGYATLLAAAALYDFVPQLAALVIAAAIAAVGVARLFLSANQRTARGTRPRGLARSPAGESRRVAATTPS